MALAFSLPVPAAGLAGWWGALKAKCAAEFRILAGGEPIRGYDLPAPDSVVFGMHDDDYYGFSRSSREAGVPVHIFNDLPLPMPAHPYAPKVELRSDLDAEVEKYARTMDYGAAHGGINLIVTTLEPAQVARFRRAVRDVEEAKRLVAATEEGADRPVFEERLRQAEARFSAQYLPTKITNWEFARALDLYPNRISFWTGTGDGGFRRLTPAETAAIKRALDPDAQ